MKFVLQPQYPHSPLLGAVLLLELGGGCGYLLLADAQDEGKSGYNNTVSSGKKV
ncbi:MAG: hypothetical protein V8T45_11190 [Oscillospiraceae bacterium]